MKALERRARPHIGEAAGRLLPATAHLRRADLPLDCGDQPREKAASNEVIRSRLHCGRRDRLAERRREDDHRQVGTRPLDEAQRRRAVERGNSVLTDRDVPGVGLQGVQQRLPRVDELRDRLISVGAEGLDQRLRLLTRAKKQRAERTRGFRGLDCRLPRALLRRRKLAHCP